VATALAAGALLAGLAVWTTPGTKVTPATVAENLTFVSHATGGAVLVPLAWFAAWQLVAWLVALDRLAWPATLVLLAGIGVLCLFAADLPQLGRPLAFAPLILVGHLTWRVHDRTLPAWAGVLLGAGCLAAVLGVERAFGLALWWYPVAAVIAVLLFLTAVRVPGPTAAAIAVNPVTRWLAAAAEWLILVGGVVVFAVLGLVT
jgi:hypothetical protein